MSAHLSAAQIKARLDHPIIDADGHWIEYGPVFTEELRRSEVCCAHSSVS